MKRLSKYQRLNRKIDLWTRFFLFAFLFLCGGVLNLSTVMRNEGRMPVYNPHFYFESSSHFAYYDRADVNMWWATDIINWGVGIVSIGDVIVFFSFVGVMIIQFQMLKFKRDERRQKWTD
jgi:hypothetical protein